MTMRLLVVLFLTVCSLDLLAQGKDNSLKGVPVRERIVTGGGLGLGFSSTQDYFSVSPMLGYRITAKLIGGSMFTYRYINYKYYKPVNVKLNDYGISPYLQFFAYKNIFLQAEYEYLNYEFVVSSKETFRRDFTSFLAGGGFVQPISDKVSFYVMALYNFSYKTPVPGEYYPYNNPLILRAGINIGNLGF